MGDRSRLKELLHRLDCQNPDPATIACIEKMAADMLGGPLDVADRIHTLAVRLKTEPKAAKGEILRLIE